jgi:hypothetical protein
MMANTIFNFIDIPIKKLDLNNTVRLNEGKRLLLLHENSIHFTNIVSIKISNILIRQ